MATGESSSINCNRAISFFVDPKTQLPTKKGILVTITSLALAIIGIVFTTFAFLAAAHQLPQALSFFGPIGVIGMAGSSALAAAFGGLFALGVLGASVLIRKPSLEVNAAKPDDKVDKEEEGKGLGSAGVPKVKLQTASTTPIPQAQNPAEEQFPEDNKKMKDYLIKLNDPNKIFYIQKDPTTFIIGSFSKAAGPQTLVLKNNSLQGVKDKFSHVKPFPTDSEMSAQEKTVDSKNPPENWEELPSLKEVGLTMETLLHDFLVTNEAEFTCYRKDEENAVIFVFGTPGPETIQTVTTVEDYQQMCETMKDFPFISHKTIIIRERQALDKTIEEICSKLQPGQYVQEEGVVYARNYSFGGLANYEPDDSLFENIEKCTWAEEFTKYFRPIEMEKIENMPLFTKDCLHVAHPDFNVNGIKDVLHDGECFTLMYKGEKNWEKIKMDKTGIVESTEQLKPVPYEVLAPRLNPKTAARREEALKLIQEDLPKDEK